LAHLARRGPPAHRPRRRLDGGRRSVAVGGRRTRRRTGDVAPRRRRAGGGTAATIPAAPAAGRVGHRRRGGADLDVRRPGGGARRRHGRLRRVPATLADGPPAERAVVSASWRRAAPALASVALIACSGDEAALPAEVECTTQYRPFAETMEGAEERTFIVERL